MLRELQFNGYRDWKFVYSLLALAPSSNHLFFGSKETGHRQEAEPLPRWLLAPFQAGTCLCHALYSGSNNIHHYYTFGSWFFPMLSSCVLLVFFFKLFFLSFFCLIMVPKAEGSIFSTQSHSLWEERMSVSGMLTSTEIWDRVFPLTFLAQHPKKYNLATVWLLWGTAYCSWKSIIPTSGGLAGGGRAGF